MNERGMNLARSNSDFIPRQGTASPKSAYHSPSALPRRLNAMQTFSDTLGQVYRAIMANKLRSFLTMF